jgi:hypothetical protein
MPRLSTVHPVATWNPDIVSVINMQMAISKVALCALELTSPPSFATSAASIAATVLGRLPLYATLSSAIAHFVPTQVPTILTKTSSCVYTYSPTADPLPLSTALSSTDVQVDWRFAKTTRFTLTITKPTFKISSAQLPPARWDAANPPPLSIERSFDDDPPQVFTLHLTTQDNVVYKLEPIQNANPAVNYTNPSYQWPQGVPRVENAPPEFTVMMWLTYVPMAPQNLGACIREWWDRELKQK